MTATHAEAIDARPHARAIVDAIHAGQINAAMNTMDHLSRSELISITVLLASVVDPGSPLITPAAAGVHGATLNVVTAAAHAACQIFDVSTSEFYGVGRRRPVANARHVVCLVAHWSGISVAEIGRAIARNHATVLTSISRADNSTELSSVAHRIMHTIEDGRPTS